METLVDPPPHARIPRVLDGANRFKADIFWCVLHRTLLRWNATTTVPTISLPTLLNPRWFDDSMKTLTLSLPLLNPIASCDSRQDEDGVVNCDATRPLHQKNKSVRKREKRQAKKQADKQRSESAPDLFLDGLEDVLDGAFMVVDAFATYRWTPERSLWMPVRAHVMMVDASNHSGWDPPRPHNRLDQGSRDRAEVRAFVITRAGTATGGPHHL
jgi:hypothetical protein